jgi:hypothetical protein
MHFYIHLSCLQSLNFLSVYFFIYRWFPLPQSRQKQWNCKLTRSAARSSLRSIFWFASTLIWICKSELQIKKIGIKLFVTGDDELLHGKSFAKPVWQSTVMCIFFLCIVSIIVFSTQTKPSFIIIGFDDISFNKRNSCRDCFALCPSGDLTPEARGFSASTHDHDTIPEIRRVGYF